MSREPKITERLAADRLLASIVASSDDAIVSKSLDGIIRSWNAAAERLFGYSAAEAVGRHISLIIPADRVSEEEHIIARIRSGERVEHFDTIRVRRDGQPVHVSLTISPVTDEAGRIVGASKIARDISERKRVEGALRESEESLQAAIDALREADRRKDEFLATLAHELRNPLAPIRSAIQVLRLRDGDASRVRSMAEILERQVRQLVRLVDDLLDISRVSRGRIELRTERTELAGVLGHVVEAARPLIREMEHTLTVTMPPRPIHLDGDPTRLAQVVGNLLNNACKYMDKGGRIALSVERVGNQAAVRVRDEGIGIAAEDLSRIFQMFAQVDTSLERSVGGLGIGLTLAKSLVEMHGGSIEARSEGPGRGSEFVVRLPILAEETESSPEPAPPPPALLPSRRILIVDDNRDGAESFALLLETLGCVTRMAHDGPEAVAAAEEFRPEVVLLDIGLPKLNGHEVCRRIRREPWGRDLTLIAVTGWGQSEDRQRSQEAGFDHHLVKPVYPNELIRLLASLPPRAEPRR